MSKLPASRDTLILEIGRALALLMQRAEPAFHPHNINQLEVAVAVFEANMKADERISLLKERVTQHGQQGSKPGGDAS